jgi:hypothetical protein
MYSIYSTLRTVVEQYERCVARGSASDPGRPSTITSVYFGRCSASSGTLVAAANTCAVFVGCDIASVTAPTEE